MARIKAKHKLRTPRRVLNFLNKIPFLLSGEKKPATVPERFIVNSFWAGIIQSMFEQIHEAYIVKSSGGTDELGISWQDLQPETKAYRKDQTRKTLSKNQKRKARSGTMGLLTLSQQKQWNSVYSSQMRQSNKFSKGAPTRADKEIAASKAWIAVLASGAETYIGELGNKSVPLGVENGTLLDSLKPGTVRDGKYIKSHKEQIASVRGGHLTLGSSVPHAFDFARFREFLPEEFDIWFDKAVEQARDNLTEAIEKAIG